MRSGSVMESEVIAIPQKRLKEKRKNRSISATPDFFHPEKSVTDFPKSEASEILAEWMKLPMWSIPKAISDVEDLKNKHERSNKLVLEHADLLNYLLKEHDEMRKEIQELKSRLGSNIEDEDIWEMNKREITKLEKMFNLPSVSKEPIEEKIAKMEGFLKKYTENDPDPVELLISMRYYG